MECRASFVLAVVLAVVSRPQSVLARRRVVIEVPVHIRSHQHTHTVYRPLPIVQAPVAPVAPVVPVAPVAPAALLYHQPQALAQPQAPATLISHRPAAQRVAHHAAPGGLTSITLVNLGRGGHTPPQADDGGEGDAEELPQQRQYPQYHQQPQYHQPQHVQNHNQQRHHVTGVNYQRTEHSAQVYRR